MSCIVLLLRVTIFAGSSGWIVPPQIEVSPVAVSNAEKFGLADAVSHTYFLVGPVSRGIRFLFHTLAWNWVSISLADYI